MNKEQNSTLHTHGVSTGTGILDLFFDNTDFDIKIAKFKNREYKAKDIFTINKIEKTKQIKAVITLADDSRHVGSIYQVCNFKYYGLTDKKTDFFTEDGRVNPRGQTKDIQGVWLPRNRKHRYAYILDKNLICLLKEEKRPTIENTNSYECCNDTNVVLDKRFNVYYSCPKCSKIARLQYWC